jgi:molybdopterin-binding protein
MTRNQSKTQKNRLKTGQSNIVTVELAGRLGIIIFIQRIESNGLEFTLGNEILYELESCDIAHI